MLLPCIVCCKCWFYFELFCIFHYQKNIVKCVCMCVLVRTWTKFYVGRFQFIPENISLYKYYSPTMLDVLHALTA